MIGMTGISGKLGISDIIIPRWYKSLPGPQIVTSFWNKPKSKRPDIPWKSYGVSKC